MRLIRDVVLLDNMIDVCSRVMISEGTEVVDSAETTGLLGYRPGSIIPKNSWRNLTRNEQKILMSDIFDVPINQSVSIIRIPERIMELFKEIGIEELATIEQGEALNSHPKLPYVVSKLIAEVAPMQTKVVRPRSLGICAQYPGMKTLTDNRAVVNHYRPNKIGLHYDSWETKPLHERKFSRNRLCLNIGFEDRYFLFMNLQLETIVHMLDSTGINYKPDQGGLILEGDFLRAFPDYCVFRLRVAPGEAYVAPTENILHDGSSIYQSKIDLVLSLLGYFKNSIAFE